MNGTEFGFAIITKGQSFPEEIVPALINFCHLMACEKTPEIKSRQEGYEVLLTTKFLPQAAGKLLGIRFDYVIEGRAEKMTGYIIFTPQPPDVVMRIRRSKTEVLSPEEIKRVLSNEYN